jgi:hypothetical protein
VKAGEVTVDKAAQLLLALKAELDAGGIAFHAVEFYLTYANGPEGITLWDFLSADIYPEGLTDRVAQAHEAYLQYWAGQE